MVGTMYVGRLHPADTKKTNHCHVMNAILTAATSVNSGEIEVSADSQHISGDLGYRKPRPFLMAAFYRPACDTVFNQRAVSHVQCPLVKLSWIQ